MGHSTRESNSRQAIIRRLLYELPILRARIGASQADIANKLGVSRQTYCSIENGKREMTWTICVALLAIFYSNAETREMLKSIDRLQNDAEQELEI